MTPVELLLSKLQKAKRSGQGWIACCPAHEDRRPSLSIAETEDGLALLKCHAGCSIDAICGALGIAKVELFPKQGRSYTRGMRRQPVRTKAYSAAREAIRDLEQQHGKRSALWTYHSVDGEPVGVIIRWDRPTGKDIRPVSRKGSRWIVGAMPLPRPLYGLPELACADPVYITEGEKAADAARLIGLIATTSAHGSESAGKTDWTPLAGKRCVILPDHDDAGRRYAEDVAAELAKLAPAPIIKICELPELPPGGDMVDFVGIRGQDADAARAEVEALADAAEALGFNCSTLAVKSFTRFPIEVLPDPLSKFVKVAAKAIGCDASYVAVPALVVAAGAIGNSYRVVLKGGWSEPAILWAAIVGESGTLKSPAFKLALKPLKRAQQAAIQQHTEEANEYEQTLVRYEADKAKWKKNGKGDPPLRPEPPRLRRVIVSDVTVEALAPILLDNPRGVVAARDELAGWVNSFDRYGNGRGSDAPAWLSMYDADSVIVDRKTGMQRTIFVPAAAVSVIGSIQPAILARSFSIEHRESGLLARLLLTMPSTRPSLWTESEISQDVEMEFDALIGRLLELSPGVDEDGSPRPRFIPLDDDARALFINWHDAHALETAEQTGELAAAYSKIKGVAARLALILHCVRVAADDSTVVSPGRIDRGSVRSAVTLVEWFKNEIGRVYEVLRESDEDRDRRRLVEWIDRRGGSVTVRDLTHGLQQYRNATDAARAALDDLVQAKFGRWTHPAPSPRGGRPSPRFQLVGGVAVTDTPVNSGADSGIGDGDDGDDGAL